MSPGDQLALLLACAILAGSAESDLRRLRIPNFHVLGIICIFVLTGPFVLDAHDALGRLISASITFAIGFGLFSLRLLGGGDVKLISAVMLLVPAELVTSFLFLFSASLLVTSIAITVAQRIQVHAIRHWMSIRARGHVPVAVSIFLATAGLLVVSGLSAAI